MSDGGPQRIEIIAADPTAFGHAAAESAAPDGKVRRRLPRPSTPVLIAALVLAALVAGVLVWQPWSEDSSGVLSLPDGAPTVPEMASELVLDNPPGPATAAGLGLEGDWTLLLAADLRIGYVVAGPGAHPELSGQDTGRWASFSATPEDDPLAPRVDEQTTTIQGAPAMLLDTGNPLLRFVVFGPVDGWLFEVRTNRLSERETLRLAESVGVRDGVPVVTDRAALADLEPIGSTAALDGLFRLVNTPGDSAIPAQDTVFVKYGSGASAAAVASITAPTDDMTAMFDFVFPSGRAVTVHDQPAVAIGGAAALGLSTFQTVVVWVEGGRIVMAGGMGGIDDTVALAESVRRATVDEWAEVALVAADTPSPLDESVNPPGRVIASAVDPTTEVESKIAVTTQPDGAVLVCFSGPVAALGFGADRVAVELLVDGVVVAHL